MLVMILFFERLGEYTLMTDRVCDNLGHAYFLIALKAAKACSSDAACIGILYIRGYFQLCFGFVYSSSSDYPENSFMYKKSEEDGKRMVFYMLINE